MNLVLSAQDHWFCTHAILGSVFSNWSSACRRQRGDQVDHARDVHSPQNPWLSLNRAFTQQGSTNNDMSRISSRLMDPSNLNSEFCDIKKETTVTTQLKQMPIRSKCPHVMFPELARIFHGSQLSTVNTEIENRMCSHQKYSDRRAFHVVDLQ